MSENHKWLSYYYFDRIDHYNSKPPFVIWSQVISSYFLGESEISYRLPTLLSLIILSLIFLKLSKKITNKYTVGFMAILILYSTVGAIRPHVFLTADLDGVLVLLITSIFFYLIYKIQNGIINNSFYYKIMLLFLLAYFTKSTAIFLIIPSCISVIFLSKNTKLFFCNNHLYFSILIFIIIVVSYYLIREHFDPGYFNIVWYSEYQRIYKVVMTWHEQPFHFYFFNIYYYENKYYLFATLFTMPIYFFQKSNKLKKYVFYFFVAILIYLFVISIPKVKLEWYTAPIYPIWAITLSIMLFEIMFNKYNFIFWNYFFQFSIVLFLIFNTFQIKSSILKNIKSVDAFSKETQLMIDYDNKNNFSNYKLLFNYNEHEEIFYMYEKLFKKNKNKIVQHLYNINEVHINDTVIVSQQNKIDSLNHFFNTKQIYQNENGNVLVILKK